MTDREQLDSLRRVVTKLKAEWIPKTVPYTPDSRGRRSDMAFGYTQALDDILEAMDEVAK